VLYVHASAASSKGFCCIIQGLLLHHPRASAASSKGKMQVDVLFVC